MIPSIKNTSTNNSCEPRNRTPSAAEETLRLIASLPTPEGLEDRVLAGVRKAPRANRVLAWPSSSRPDSGWMRDWMQSSLARTAAAAAIVFVVTGGGWSIYSRVAPPRPVNGPVSGIVRPRAVAPGGFSGAGAMRTPQTLNGPIVAHPATAEQPEKPVAKSTPQKPHRGKSALAKKAAPSVK